MKKMFALALMNITLNGLLTLDDTDTETNNDNYGLHCNMQSTSHCTETLPLMPLATFSYFIGLATYIVLGVAECEHILAAVHTVGQRKRLFIATNKAYRLYGPFTPTFFSTIFATI